MDQTASYSGKIGPELEGTVHSGGESLRRLLRETAAMITVVGVEQISFDELARRFEEAHQDGEDSRSSLDDWVAAATDDKPLHRLVVNFLFKGGHRELGCEFLHKSFREYLFAEAVLDVLEGVPDGASGPKLAIEHEYWKDFEEREFLWRYTRNLARLLAPQWMTPEVRGHLFWLIHEHIQANQDRWLFIRDALAEVYGWWAEGVHLRPQPMKKRGNVDWSSAYIDELVRWKLPYEQRLVEPVRSAALDAHLGDALLQITAFVHAELRRAPGLPGRSYQAFNEGAVAFRPGGRGYFSHIVSRIDCGAKRPGGRRASGAWLREVSLEGEILQGEVFDLADLTRADLSRCQLLGTTFRRAILREARFEGTEVRNADFDGADLSNASLAEEHLFDVQDKPKGTKLFAMYHDHGKSFKLRSATWRNAKLPEPLVRFHYGDQDPAPNDEAEEW